MSVPNSPAGPRNFASTLTPSKAGAVSNPTINEPRALAPSAINPTKNNARAASPSGTFFAKGTITCIARALLVNNDYFTVSDGFSVVVFEYRVNGGYTPVGGRVTIDVSGGGGTVANVTNTTAAALVANLNLAASVSSPVISLVDSRPGPQGNVLITENVADVGFLVSGMSGGALTTSPNAPLLATASARINWTPNTGPQAAVRATAPVATRTAGILAADGSVVAGSGGPPYVSGNVTVGENQVGTNVILTPPIE